MLVPGGCRVIIAGTGTFRATRAIAQERAASPWSRFHDVDGTSDLIAMVGHLAPAAQEGMAKPILKEAMNHIGFMGTRLPIGPPRTVKRFEGFTKGWPKQNRDRGPRFYFRSAPRWRKGAR